MSPDCKKTEIRQLNPVVPVDRISDLPDVILQHIIYFLDRAAAYRTTVLSKRWTHITATNPVLKFDLKIYSKETTASFLKRVEPTMQRYSKESLIIRKLALHFIGFDVEFACKVDEWLGIVVSNQVMELDLSGPDNYQLPTILFSAKSLTHLKCYGTKLPYYQTIDLMFLKSLILEELMIEDGMLNQMISSCLSLTVLSLNYCYFYESIVIPPHSKLEMLDLFQTLPLGGKVFVETSSLTNIKAENRKQGCWPILISETGLLRNLKILHISLTLISDDEFAYLLSELSLLETLVFRGCQACHELNNINITSFRLKEICIDDCGSLLDVVIYAPSLKKFRFNCKLLPPLSVSIRYQASCSVSLHILPDNLDNDGFFELKQFLIGLESSNVSLKVLLLNEVSDIDLFPMERVKADCDVIQFYEKDFELSGSDEELDEEAEGVHLGPPCAIRKLKLNVSDWILSDASLSAFLNGLFWCCHPDILSLRVYSGTSNEIIQPLIRKLENMANCWRHPLKRVEGGNTCFDVLKPWKIVIELRLYW